MIRLALPTSSADLFIRAAARWQESFKKDVSVLLRQQSRSILTNTQRTGIIDLTPPTVGTSSVGSVSEQKKSGQAAVARDIRKIFITAKGAVKKAKEEDKRGGRILSRLLREGKAQDAINLLRSGGGQAQVQIKAHSRAGGVIVAGYRQTRSTYKFKSLSAISEIQSSPDQAMHRRFRDSRGRVNQSRQRMIVMDASSLANYIRKKQALVGFHKSGWKASAAAVGASVPSYVSQNNGPGRVIDNFAKEGPRFGVTFINDTPGIARHNRVMSIAQRAIQYAAGRIDRAVRGYLQRRQRL